MAEPQPQLDLGNTASPFQQPVLDNNGRPAAPLQTQTQTPDRRPVVVEPQAQRRGQISDAQYDRLGRDEQTKYARIGTLGNSEWVERSQLAEDSGIRPESGVPGEKVRVGEMEVTQAELQEFFQSKADAELRKGQLPASPEAYETKLPENFELPAGVEFKFNEADPLLIDARNWAHSKGWDQGTFSEMLGLYASAQAREQAQINTAHAAEVAKMGANGVQRVTALEQWLRGMVGDKLAGPMRGMIVTADIAKGLETLQQKFSSQGAASFSQAHREPGEGGGKVSSEVYSKMSAAEKLDYARGFDQTQFGGTNPSGYGDAFGRAR